MDEDERELVRHLCATLSARIEQALDISLELQAPVVNLIALAELTHRLEANIAEIAVLVRAIGVLVSVDRAVQS